MSVIPRGIGQLCRPLGWTSGLLAGAPSTSSLPDSRAFASPRPRPPDDALGHHGSVITESFYLGPTRRPVPLRSWEEVVSAAQAGVLDETQWVELKQDVPASSKSANLELAKDLASLSVDGGLLVIGVADGDRKAGDVVGARLQGWKRGSTRWQAGRSRRP